MGMINQIEVKNNSLGIPEGVYQTKSLIGALDTYVIDGDGVITLTKVLNMDFENWHSIKNTPERIPAVMTGVDGSFEIYGDLTVNGNTSWHEYELYIKNGKVTSFESYGSDEDEIVYENVVWLYT